jgi:hypothetical protein
MTDKQYYTLIINWEARVSLRVINTFLYNKAKILDLWTVDLQTNFYIENHCTRSTH